MHMNVQSRYSSVFGVGTNNRMAALRFNLVIISETNEKKITFLIIVLLAGNEARRGIISQSA